MILSDISSRILIVKGKEDAERISRDIDSNHKTILTKIAADIYRVEIINTLVGSLYGNI